MIEDADKSLQRRIKRRDKNTDRLFATGEVHKKYHGSIPGEKSIRDTNYIREGHSCMSSIVFVTL